ASIRTRAMHAAVTSWVFAEASMCPAGVVRESVLEEKLAQLERARGWSPRVMSRLESLLHLDDAVQLYRINPLHFDAERNLPQLEAIDLFLHATKLGLFRMEWRLLCPACGDTLDSLSSLSLVHTRCFCSLCRSEAEMRLDDLIQISFTVAED